MHQDACTHAGLAVLTDQSLWQLITDCMVGYPFVVLELLKNGDTIALEQLTSQRLHVRRLLHGSLVTHGVLPHLAIEANDAVMLKRLYRLRCQPAYQRDERLSFERVMRCAVLLKRIDMLECIAALRMHREFEWPVEPNLALLVLTAAPDVRLLEWLHAHNAAALYHNAMRDAIANAAVAVDVLALVRWLHERGCRITRDALDSAAARGHLQALAYLYTHSKLQCGRDALCDAARRGFVDVVELIVSKRTSVGSRRDASQFAVYAAAENGQLALVRYLVERNALDSSSSSSAVELFAPRAIDFAAKNGHLNIVQYLHARFPQTCCTFRAMRDAAANGHLATVEFLHAHRSEGCSRNALSRAVRNGHLDVVRFLHAAFGYSVAQSAMDQAAADGRLDMVAFLHHSGAADAEGCSVRAMDVAAQRGHMAILAFLQEHRSEGCSANALRFAAKNSHLDVIAFLMEHRRAESDVVTALERAATRGDLAIVKLLQRHLPVGATAYRAMRTAMINKHEEIVTYLCERQEREPQSFFMQATQRGQVYVARALLPFASQGDIASAKAFRHQEGKDK